MIETKEKIKSIQPFMTFICIYAYTYILMRAALLQRCRDAVHNYVGYVDSTLWKLNISYL